MIKKFISCLKMEYYTEKWIKEDKFQKWKSAFWKKKLERRSERYSQVWERLKKFNIVFQ